MPREKGAHCWVLTLFESTGNTQCWSPKGLHELELTENAHKPQAASPAAEPHAQGRDQHTGTRAEPQCHTRAQPKAGGGSASSQWTKHRAPGQVRPLLSRGTDHRGSSAESGSRRPSRADLAGSVYSTAVVAIPLSLLSSLCLGREHPSTEPLQRMELHQPKVICWRTRPRSLCCKPA